MTAMTTPQFAAPSKDAVPSVPLGKLTKVELRKMVDTRAGRWLLICAVGVVLIVLAVASATSSDARSFTDLFAIAQFPTSIILPVIGILAATSEWSQRTVLTTFSLTPKRSRVLTAKLLAALVLALAAVVVTLVLAAIFAVLAPAFGDSTSTSSFTAADLGRDTLFQVFNMLLGVALGTLLLNTALAIVLNFVLPTIWSGITGIKGLGDLQQWLDTGTTWVRLLNTDIAKLTGEQWAQAGTTALLWIVLPMALGLYRVLHKEVD